VRSGWYACRQVHVSKLQSRFNPLVELSIGIPGKVNSSLFGNMKLLGLLFLFEVYYALYYCVQVAEMHIVLAVFTSFKRW